MQVKKMAAGVTALLAFSFLTQCSTQGEQPGSADSSAGVAVAMPDTDRISMPEFKKLLASDAVVVLDVRSNGAYVGGHIPGALSMPEETLDSAAAEKLKMMGKPIATYCSWADEHTSARAAQTLQEMGVPARAVVGGLNLWVQEKNPLKTGTDPR